MEECVLASDNNEIRYVPFERVNTEARLVIVGITPGRTQLMAAYVAAQGWLSIITRQYVAVPGFIRTSHPLA